jgi:ketosteroid isomerase-like protein
MIRVRREPRVAGFNGQRTRRVALLCTLWLWPLVIACTSPSTLTTRDRAAIESLDSTYAAAWLADDTAGVLSTLSSGAVLMPAGGSPLVDSVAIHAFWWPRDGSHTRILSFRRSIDGVDGTAEWAAVRGQASFTFVHTKDGHADTLSSRVTTLSIVHKIDTRWLISQRMWAPRPADTR